MPATPTFPTFQDRDLELGLILGGPTADVRILNFHGEAGIGKSRLLEEAESRLRSHPRSLIVHLDLATLQAPEVRQAALLQQLAEQSGLSQAISPDPDTAAGEVVDSLSTLGRNHNATLLVDTTEVAQNDPAFWQWLERHLLSPLASEGSILIVLAGRLPAPIRLVELRRYLKVVSLDPLPVHDQARQLVREVLKVERASRPWPDWDEELENEMTQLALDFSHGHPLLSIYIAAYLADPINQEPLESLRYRVATGVVGPFIDDELFPFQREMARWRQVMEWASVLDWFDATVLYRFDRAISGLSQPETEWQHDFVRAIAQLRSPYAVVAWQDQGYSLVGTVKSIVASYMQAAREPEYIEALKAAEEVFDVIADELFADNPQAGEPYRQAAQGYQKRLEREVQDGTAN